MRNVTMGKFDFPYYNLDISYNGITVVNADQGNVYAIQKLRMNALNYFLLDDDDYAAFITENASDLFDYESIQYKVQKTPNSTQGFDIFIVGKLAADTQVARLFTTYKSQLQACEETVNTLVKKAEKLHSDFGAILQDTTVA